MTLFLPILHPQRHDITKEGAQVRFTAAMHMSAGALSRCRTHYSPFPARYRAIWFRVLHAQSTGGKRSDVCTTPQNVGDKCLRECCALQSLCIRIMLTKWSTRNERCPEDEDEESKVTVMHCTLRWRGQRIRTTRNLLPEIKALLYTSGP